MHARNLLVVVGVSLSLATSTGCGRQSSEDASHEVAVAPTPSPVGQPQARAGVASPIFLSPEQADAIGLETIAATSHSMRARLGVMGKVLAPQTRKAIVSYAFPARIAEVHVAIGDWVKRGQAVVTLQSEEVGEARSAYYKARADRELAKANDEREKLLFDRGVGAQKSHLAAEVGLKVADANLDAAEKKLHVLGFTEEQVRLIDQTHQVNPVITLFAPVAGRVIENNAVLGAMVDQSTEILTIMDPTTLWIDADVYERDIAKVRTGQEVEVTVPAYPGEVFRGRISYIGDVLEEETRTVTVRTEVQNPQHRLKPGMFADVVVFLNGATKVLTLPQEAVLDDGNDKIVFVAVDDGYLPRVVEVGSKHDGQVEIVRGLEEGEMVVTAGCYQLKSKLHEQAGIALH